MSFHLETPLSHAYGIFGGHDTVLQALTEELGRLSGTPILSSPDLRLFLHKGEHFAIEESRLIREVIVREPVTAFGITIIASGAMFGIPAQNALLKITEEAPTNSRLFIVAPSRHHLLPTLCSRLTIVTLPEYYSPEEIAWGEKFLKGSNSDRLAMIGHFSEKDLDHDVRMVHKEEAIRYCRVLVEVLRRYLGDVGKRASAERALAEVSRTATYLADSGSMVGLLMEHLALSI